MAARKLVQVDDNLFTVAAFDGRRMTVARLERGELVVYGAIALPESEMLALDAIGEPAYLVVTNDVERQDLRPWKLRYPATQIIAPAAARARLGPTVYVDATWIDFGDPRVQYITVAGPTDREPALVVESRFGTLLVLDDHILDLRDGHHVESELAA